jgi:hypothetical protein
VYDEQWRMLSHRLTQGIVRIFRLCSGILTFRSGMLTSAQVKVAIAHVRKLKGKQRKGKLVLGL